MYFLRLTCPACESETVSAELWDAGTAGIQEIDYEEETLLLAGFENNDNRAALLQRFTLYAPEWEHEDTTDWIAHTKEAWPPRSVGEHFYLAPPWCEEATPKGRHRVIHNPGLACGTGEHPCTQLALEALENCVSPGHVVVDVGTGSGILAIAALRMGAAIAVGIDTDMASLSAAKENFVLNDLPSTLAAGSADALRSGGANVAVANISGTVLLHIADELLRITKPKGTMILTGFPEWELPPFCKLFPNAAVSAINEWRCLLVSL
jgi:ribosomal protein L11 methyltransferase